MLKYLFLIGFIGLQNVQAQDHPKVGYGKFQISGIGSDTSHSSSLTGIGNLRWKFKTHGKVFSSPAVYNGITYIGSEDRYLYAIEASTGTLLWKFATGGTVNSSPSVYKNRVYFGSFDSFYYSVNAITGKLIWKFKTGGEKKVGANGLWTMKPKNLYMKDQFDFFLSSPVINTRGKEITVYFGSSDGNLYALDGISGKKKWTYKTNGIIRSSPSIYLDKVFIGSWDRFLYALDVVTGKLKWKFETHKQPIYHLLEGIQSSPVCASGLVYFGSRDGFLYALNTGDGKEVWKYNANNSWVVATATVSRGMVYTGTSDTFLFLGFDAKTGKEKLRYKSNGYIYSSPAILTNTAYFGDFSGRLLAVDLKTGKLTGKFSTNGHLRYASRILNTKGDIDFNFISKGMDNSLYATSTAVMNKLYTLGPIVSSPVINNSVIYVGSTDGYLYAINLK